MYVPESPKNVEELYAEVIVIEDDLSDIELLSAEVAYKQTETDLQKFAVTVEQANADHRNKEGIFYGR